MQLAVIDPAQAAALIKRALAMAETIYDGGQRIAVLAHITGLLAGAAPDDLALVERAQAVAETIPQRRGAP